MKETAVEWYAEQGMKLEIQRLKGEISTEKMLNLLFEKVRQAKAMEKEQIIEAIRDTEIELRGYYNDGDAEYYYNETFKSEKIVMFMTPGNGEIESIILTDNPDCGVKGIIFKSE